MVLEYIEHFIKKIMKIKGYGGIKIMIMLNKDDLLSKRCELEFLITNEEAPATVRERAYEHISKLDNIMNALFSKNLI